MTAERIVIVSLGVWAAAWALSVLHPYVTAPTGGGFVKGMNLVVIFLGWQVLALIAAAVAAVTGAANWETLGRSRRRLALLPAGVSALVIAGLCVLYVAMP